MAIEIVDFPSENGDFMWFSSSLWDSLPGRVINKSTTCVQWSKWTARPSGDDPTTFQDRSAWYKKRNIPVEHQTCMCAYIQNVYIYIHIPFNPINIHIAVAFISPLWTITRLDTWLFVMVESLCLKGKCHQLIHYILCIYSKYYILYSNYTVYWIWYSI